MGHRAERLAVNTFNLWFQASRIYVVCVHVLIFTFLFGSGVWNQRTKKARIITVSVLRDARASNQNRTVPAPDGGRDIVFFHLPRG